MGTQGPCPEGARLPAGPAPSLPDGGGTAKGRRGGSLTGSPQRPGATLMLTAAIPAGTGLPSVTVTVCSGGAATQARVRRILHIPAAPRYDICCISQAPRVPLPEGQSRDLGLLHLGPESFGHSHLRRETRPARHPGQHHRGHSCTF